MGPSVVSGWPITTEILSCIHHSIKDEIMIVDLALISAGNLFVWSGAILPFSWVLNLGQGPRSAEMTRHTSSYVCSKVLPDISAFGTSFVWSKCSQLPYLRTYYSNTTRIHVHANFTFWPLLKWKRQWIFFLSCILTIQCCSAIHPCKLRTCSPKCK